MKRSLVTSLLALAVAGLGVVALPTPAASGPPLWSVSVRAVNTTMPGNGGEAGFEVACPTGQTPIGGSYSVWGGSNTRRLLEEVGWGSGARYGVVLRSALNTPDLDATIRAYCVPTTYFSTSVLKSGVFTASSSGIAAGTVSCDPGWYSLSSRVTFNTFAAGPIRTSTPDMEFDAWFAVATAPAGSQMIVTVRCVPASDMSNARFASASVPIGGNGTSAQATCPAGMAPIVGGTWQDSGSGAVTTQPQPYLPTRSFVSSTFGGTGTMRTNVVCLPSELPTVSVTAGTPWPSPNSPGASWTFSASDPAASGGYGLSTQCSLDSGGFVGCVSPVQYGGLADGTHTLDVRAISGDGRVSPVQRSTVRIDTTAPVLTFPGPVIHPGNAASVAVAVSDADHVVSFRCAVDGAEAVPCGGAQLFQGSATTNVTWSGPLTDGPHVVQVTATDTRGNATTGDHAFTVDTTAPHVSQGAPSVRFTIGTSVTVAWSGSDATSGISSYDVRRRSAATDQPFSGWTTVSSPGTATARRFGSLLHGATYCFSVRAVDHAGHASPWTGERCTAVPLDDRDLARSSGWSMAEPAGWFRRTALVSTTRGATLAVTGTTLKRAALVAQACPRCGVAGIYVGGTLVGKVDLAAGTTSRRTVVLPAFPMRTGTVTVRVLSSGERVMVDALGVSRR